METQPNKVQTPLNYYTAVAAYEKLRLGCDVTLKIGDAYEATLEWNGVAPEFTDPDGNECAMQLSRLNRDTDEDSSLQLVFHSVSENAEALVQLGKSRQERYKEEEVWELSPELAQEVEQRLDDLARFCFENRVPFVGTYVSGIDEEEHQSAKTVHRSGSSMGRKESVTDKAASPDAYAEGLVRSTLGQFMQDQMNDETTH